MGALSALTGLIWLALMIGLVVFVVQLVLRLVRAQEKSALALERLSRSVEQIAQSGTGGPGAMR